MTVIRRERDFNRLGAQHAGILEHRFEGWLRGDSVLARRQECHVGDSQDFAGSASENNVVARYAVKFRECIAHLPMRDIGIPRRNPPARSDCSDRLWRRSVRILVRADADHARGSRRARRRAVFRVRRKQMRGSDSERQVPSAPTPSTTCDCASTAKRRT